ncbi:hypothetical protein CDL12_17552 [Handroanthus impetiginosus]|uniref:Histone acetyltransferase n=1 Tax=Handroanthus impetiginosus TaxID=429701 RepID=A0A2G9GXD6_9LAMI|nr:hypothetical protein CDL12_17552 [Handroanthus impetiginosus]
MPRPGPRPYECVRRAWHSDRHHPIRGSLIQEIFRIVNEVHCSATKKNRQWQEKLPIVVLKAEEIMYSKANSEAEYSDLKTLWDRVNDAINTIIRRDESTESGELLQPCIEAALQLGCTPRRSSRSQRNDSPRYYLRPEILDATSVPDSSLNAKVYGNHITNSPLMLHYSKISTIGTMNPLHSYLKPGNHSIQSRISGFPQNDDHHASVQTHASSNTWSVYPLYCDNQIQPDEPKVFSSKPSNSNSHLIESDKLGLQQNRSPFKLDASNFIFPSNHDHTSNKGHRAECDLTLRLGSLVVPRASIENGWSPQVENGNSNTLEGKKFMSRLNK